MSNVRTWPDERLTEVRRNLEDARRAYSAAERLYKEGESARVAQERDEARCRRDDVAPFYVPTNTTPADFHEMQANRRGLVYRWISDEELVTRKDAYEAAQGLLEKAEKAYTKTRAEAVPVTETAMREAGQAIGALFAVCRELRVGGTVYPAGAPLPVQITDGFDHWKLQRWLDVGLVRRID